MRDLLRADYRIIWLVWSVCCDAMILVRDVHGVDEERIYYEDVAGLVEGAHDAANKGVCEIHDSWCSYRGCLGVRNIIQRENDEVLVTLEILSAQPAQMSFLSSSVKLGAASSPCFVGELMVEQK